MVRVFVTGATGYIGGDALHELYNEHPEYTYVALVRTAEKAEAVSDKFPKVRTVIGDNDSGDLIREESSKADIVIHTADSSDHAAAARSIAEGLAAGHSKEKPGYWLHLGGTGILTYFDTRDDKLGEDSDKVFDDGDGVGELTSLPSEAFHRDVDEIVLETGVKHGGAVKTAIICPPTIYGVGRGPSLVRGRQAYELAKTTLKIKKAPVIGKGKARWNNVHLYDLTRAYLLLVEAAVTSNDSDELWGAKGYHIIENGEHCWGDLAKLMAEKAKEKGLIEEAGTQQMDYETAMKTADFQAVSWGLNSRAKAVRLGKNLGWKPRERSLADEVPDILQQEWERLQKG